MTALDFIERWDNERLSSLFIENTTKNFLFEEKNALQFFFGSIIPKKKYELTEDLIETYRKYTIVFPGDIILNGLNLNYDFVSQRTALVKNQGIITSAYIALRLRNRERLNEHYYCYLFKAMDAKKIFHGMGAGIRLTLSFKDLKNYILPVPPRSEQDQIVRFLDWKVSGINRLINIKKKEIKQLEDLKLSRLFTVATRGLNENVKLIDSGIEHIGLVPSHWKILLNHRIYKENCRSYSGAETVLSLSQKDGLLPYVEMKERSLHTASYENWKLVLPNDLVLNRFKAHLGVFFNSNYRGIVTFHYGVYEPIMKVASKYYEVLYHTPKYKQVFAGASNGMTVGLQNLSNTNFYKVFTVYPPYEEQCAIVAEVQKIENKMHAIISTISKEIGILHEFKTRLISDVVTGKIDVRGIEIPEYEFVEETVDTDNDESMEGETYEE